MPERACQFAEQGRLNGVMTLPDSSSQPNTALILITAGFTPKQGPYRLYATFARRLAEDGVATLRFDLGGIGNSEVLHTGVSLKERTIADIREAVDLIHDTIKPEHIIVGGLCSGAEDAIRYAETDERITGVLMVDPHAYKTAMWSVHNVLSRLFFNRVIYKILRVLRLIRVGNKRGTEGFEGELVKYQYMDKTESSRILETLNSRGVRYHYIYTGGLGDVFNHRNQFYRMFSNIRFKGLETVTFLPEIEHVQVFQEDRNKLLDVMQDWMQKSFG